MENEIVYKQQKFDSFVNRTIIFSSKYYFKKQMNIRNKERVIVDDDNYSAFLQEFIGLDDALSGVEKVDDRIQLNTALKSLSAIEQSVIFLLFNEELSQEEASKILEICSNSVSRIKLRAIDKLKKFMKGDLYNEK